MRVTPRACAISCRASVERCISIEDFTTEATDDAEKKETRGDLLPS